MFCFCFLLEMTVITIKVRVVGECFVYVVNLYLCVFSCQPCRWTGAETLWEESRAFQSSARVTTGNIWHKRMQKWRRMSKDMLPSMNSEINKDIFKSWIINYFLNCQAISGLTSSPKSKEKNKKYILHKENIDVYIYLFKLSWWKFQNTKNCNGFLTTFCLCKIFFIICVWTCDKCTLTRTKCFT